MESLTQRMDVDVCVDWLAFVCVVSCGCSSRAVRLPRGLSDAVDESMGTLRARCQNRAVQRRDESFNYCIAVIVIELRSAF
jgi:hypothetical protein